MKSSTRDSNLPAICYESCAFPTTADDSDKLLLISDIPFQITISSVFLAKTIDNRLEIKLAYATPNELQGQKIQ